MAIYLKETMTPKNGGYWVLPFARKNIITNEIEDRVKVFDGNTIVMDARPRTIIDYLEESVRSEYFEACQIFRTTRGYYFIYWRDKGFDYITKITGIREV